jgi:Mce-associated membrane protein
MAKAKVAPKKKVEDSAPRVSTRHRIRAVGRSVRRGLRWWRPILLTTLLVATLGFGAGYFYIVYRPDLQTDKAARHEVVKAASDGAVALLSYSPETLERDFSNAKSRLTESYLTYYQQFADQIVGPAAQRGQVTTTATVIRAAVSEINPNSAVVLVFVKQKTASKEKPQPIVTSTSVRVTLAKVKGSWLIEKFEGL